MQINARDWIFQVSENPGEASPTWADVSGLESFTLSNSEGEETTDTSTFASAGIAESQVMQRGAACSLEGKVVKADPGQAAVDALAQLVGEDSLGGFRFRHVDDTDWTQWTAWVSKGDNGGGINEKTTWSASFTRSGAATVVPVV